jgi:hypothetical protein
MVETSMPGQVNDDPRKLSAMIARAGDLAASHEVASVVVGLAAEQGDGRFPEYVDFLQGSLRVEDAIFRMTRERAVVHLADCTGEQADRILDRLESQFLSEFPSLSKLSFVRHAFAVKPGAEKPRVKDVLTEIFKPRVLH